MSIKSSAPEYVISCCISHANNSLIILTVLQITLRQQELDTIKKCFQFLALKCIWKADATLGYIVCVHVFQSQGGATSCTSSQLPCPHFCSAAGWPHCLCEWLRSHGSNDKPTWRWLGGAAHPHTSKFPLLWPHNTQRLTRTGDSQSHLSLHWFMWPVP